MPPIPNPNAVPSFEQVDRHVRALDMGLFAVPMPGPSDRSLPNPAELLDRVKAIYGAARPVIQAFATLPVLPPQWRAVVSGFLGAMDAITGVA